MAETAPPAAPAESSQHHGRPGYAFGAFPNADGLVLVAFYEQEPRFGSAHP